MIGKHCNLQPSCNWNDQRGPVGCGCSCEACAEARAAQDAARYRGGKAKYLEWFMADSNVQVITMADLDKGAQMLRDAPVPRFQGDPYGVREDDPSALRVNVEVCPQAPDGGNVTPKNMTAQEVGACVTALILTGRVVELHVTRNSFRVMCHVPSDVPYPVLENVRDELVAVRQAAMEALAQGKQR